MKTNYNKEYKTIKLMSNINSSNISLKLTSPNKDLKRSNECKYNNKIESKIYDNNNYKVNKSNLNMSNINTIINNYKKLNSKNTMSVDNNNTKTALQSSKISSPTNNKKTIYLNNVNNNNNSLKKSDYKNNATSINDYKKDSSIKFITSKDNISTNIKLNNDNSTIFKNKLKNLKSNKLFTFNSKLAGSKLSNLNSSNIHSEYNSKNSTINAGNSRYISYNNSKDKNLYSNYKVNINNDSNTLIHKRSISDIKSNKILNNKLSKSIYKNTKLNKNTVSSSIQDKESTVKAVNKNTISCFDELYNINNSNKKINLNKKNNINKFKLNNYLIKQKNNNNNISCTYNYKCYNSNYNSHTERFKISELLSIDKRKNMKDTTYLNNSNNKIYSDYLFTDGNVPQGPITFEIKKEYVKLNKSKEANVVLNSNLDITNTYNYVKSNNSSCLKTEISSNKIANSKSKKTNINNRYSIDNSLLEKNNISMLSKLKKNVKTSATTLNNNKIFNYKITKNNIKNDLINKVNTKKNKNLINYTNYKNNKIQSFNYNSTTKNGLSNSSLTNLNQINSINLYMNSINNFKKKTTIINNIYNKNNVNNTNKIINLQKSANKSNSKFHVDKLTSSCSNTNNNNSLINSKNLTEINFNQSKMNNSNKFHNSGNSYNIVKNCFEESKENNKKKNITLYNYNNSNNNAISSIIQEKENIKNVNVNVNDNYNIIDNKSSNIYKDLKLFKYQLNKKTSTKKFNNSKLKEDVDQFTNKDLNIKQSNNRFEEVLESNKVSSFKNTNLLKIDIPKSIINNNNNANNISNALLSKDKTISLDNNNNNNDDNNNEIDYNNNNICNKLNIKNDDINTQFEKSEAIINSIKDNFLNNYNGNKFINYKKERYKKIVKKSSSNIKSYKDLPLSSNLQKNNSLKNINSMTTKEITSTKSIGNIFIGYDDDYLLLDQSDLDKSLSNLEYNYYMKECNKISNYIKHCK